MTLTIEDAQARLPELLASLPANEEVVICQDGTPVARLTRLSRTSWPCQPGSAKDTAHWMAPDFDAPLEDFREYME